MKTNPLVRLVELGQSPWYDYITRDLILSGELERLIAEDGLRGMTTNPTIFEKAISGSDLYDGDLERHAASGLSAEEIFEALAVADVRRACDLFEGVYAAAGGHDGLVSIEVSPSLAYDTGGTIAAATRLWSAVGRPNAMIKIPGTAAGLPAIEECIARGINVNTTLLFSVDRYRQVVEAFFTGLERRASRGDALDRVAAVASFFVSRVDTKVDARLDESGDPESLRGRIAIANGRAAYAEFRRAFAGERWKRLERRGARPQRPLWASTSTKDPRYPDVYYVDALVAPSTVNTLPPATFDAYRDHGDPVVRMDEETSTAMQELENLGRVGIDLRRVTDELEQEGVRKFADSYDALLAGIDSKLERLGTVAGGD